MFKNKRVLVAGLGKSGVAAANLLKRMAAKVVVYDGKKDSDVSELAGGIDKWLGDYDKSNMEGLDLCVISPGMPLDCPFVMDLKSFGIKIISEIELAYLCDKGSVMAITGTNGKTTTTTLVGEIMKAWNNETYIVGNIGNPYSEIADKTSENSVSVAEISSFQLETIDEFKPEVCAILNITPDHLNRHKTMENYIDAKFAITKNQTEGDLCILNYEDEIIREKAKDISSACLYFSSKRRLEQGIYEDENRNIILMPSDEIVLNQDETMLPGAHNAENIMAAILMTMFMGVDLKVIKSTIKSFKPVEHRVEFVRNVNGVDYYNDSKGTNTDAAIKGIMSMTRPTILIGGGYDKGGSFKDWIKCFDGRVKKLLLMGVTAPRIAEEAKECGFEDFEIIDTYENVLKRAVELAEDGDAVLLSPACASWDMFDSYEQRGNIFKEFVRGLE